LLHACSPHDLYITLPNISLGLAKTREQANFIKKYPKDIEQATYN
jgi:hypothetical protein